MSLSEKLETNSSSDLIGRDFSGPPIKGRGAPKQKPIFGWDRITIMALSVIILVSLITITYYVAKGSIPLPDFCSSWGLKALEGITASVGISQILVTPLLIIYYRKKKKDQVTLMNKRIEIAAHAKKTEKEPEIEGDAGDKGKDKVDP